MDERAAISLVSDLVTAAGDDAAILDGFVFTIDMLHETTDFPSGTTRYTAGWRSIGASLSDIAAMGGEAIATVAVYGAPSFDPEGLQSFVEGAISVSESVDADYVGGDLDQHDEFTVATAAIGRVDEAIGRDGARPDDVACVTGSLGRTAAALRAFEDGDIAIANELFRFQPRIAPARRMGARPTASMDSSDGLARSLHQLAEASNVGFAIEGDSIPIAEELVAREPAETVLDTALGFGEDFELVCTLDPPDVEAVQNDLDVPLSVIGRVTEPEAGITIDGRELSDSGYTHGA